MDATITKFSNQDARAQAPRRPAISNATMGMVFLLATEAMLFAGFISAYIVSRAQAVAWPPPDQPRLPVESTALNTFFLLLSPVLICLASTACRNGPDYRKCGRYLLIAAALGALFVVLQGREWIRLIDFGLTSQSSLYGAFFYLIIGAHAVHVCAGLVLLATAWIVLRQAPPRHDPLAVMTVASMYWYFVVGLWPILYVMVYIL